ncbi:MAG: DUF2059 domain-containing protein [Deltaproteobacteria bacterium]|nr:DUF2059 domain-containing protein [Deltaproteobacteria bacterium]
MQTLLLCALLAAAPTPAKSAEPTKATASSKSKLDKIHKLLHLTKADQAGQNMLASLKGRVPDAQYARLEKLIKPEELADKLAGLYDKHFQESEIDGLLAFYATPLGQRLIQESPAIAQESVAMSQTYAMEKLQQLSSATTQPSDVPAK